MCAGKVMTVKKLASWLLMVALIGLSIAVVVLAGAGERAIPADIGCADCPPATGTEETIAWPSANLDPQVNSWPPPGCIDSGVTCCEPSNRRFCFRGWTMGIVLECRRIYVCPDGTFWEVVDELCVVIDNYCIW